MRIQLAVLGLAWSGAFASVARAEEKAAPPPSAPAEDSLAAAKRDFEALRANRGAGNAGKSELPQVNLPGAQIGTPEVAAPLMQTRKTLPKKKSENWLLDAMEKKPDQNGRKDRKDRADTLASERVLLGLGSDGRSDATTEQDLNGAPAGPVGSAPVLDLGSTAKEPERKPDPAAVNPLTTFLAGWMTPKDYALLKPGMGGEAATKERSVDSGTTPVALATPDANAALFGGFSAAFGLPATSAPAKSGAADLPRDNPYLQLQTLPAPPATGFTPIAPLGLLPEPAPGPGSASTIFAPAPMSAPEKSKMPDFAKPPTDDKYFKQLKRF